jgi:hypothetical protein
VLSEPKRESVRNFISLTDRELRSAFGEVDHSAIQKRMLIAGIDPGLASDFRPIFSAHLE